MKRNISVVVRKVVKLIVITALVFSFDFAVLVVAQKMGYKVTIHVYRQVDPNRPNTAKERNGFTLRLY